MGSEMCIRDRFIKPAPGVELLDNSDLSLQEVIEKVISLIPGDLL